MIGCPKACRLVTFAAAPQKVQGSSQRLQETVQRCTWFGIAPRMKIKVWQKRQKHAKTFDGLLEILRTQ
jgi:hypothetical protein